MNSLGRETLSTKINKTIILSAVLYGCEVALIPRRELKLRKLRKLRTNSEILSSHGGEYDVQSCLLGYTAV
jgi:hypothetical protein